MAGKREGKRLKWTRKILKWIRKRKCGYRSVDPGPIGKIKEGKCGKYRGD
jgi:hypothetical protein